MLDERHQGGVAHGEGVRPEEAGRSNDGEKRRVAAQDATEFVGELLAVLPPRQVSRREVDLTESVIEHLDEQRLAALDVAVERGVTRAELVGECTHGELLEPVLVDELERGGGDPFGVEPSPASPSAALPAPHSRFPPGRRTEFHGCHCDHWSQVYSSVSLRVNDDYQ